MGEVKLSSSTRWNKQLQFFFFSSFCDPRRVELVLSELPHRGSGNIDIDLFLYIPGVFAGGKGECCLLGLCEEQLSLKIASGGVDLF